MPTYEQIKSEMQGPRGLIKQVRNQFLPNTVEMARLSQVAYEAEGVGFQNIDAALDRLLVLEYNIYLEKQEQVNVGFIRYADSVSTHRDYPCVRETISDYVIRLERNDNPTDVLGGISKIITALADSNRQSRVARAGTSLMEHIAYLLQIKGFIFNNNFQREHVLGSGCKVDFFFPNDEEYNITPENCFSVACQTTSNDRFRLSIAQMPQITNTRNRACTAIGCSNFSDRLGPSSLTSEKLAEARRNNVKFVILESAIDTRLRESHSVISYNEWFAELNHIKGLWR